MNWLTGKGHTKNQTAWIWSIASIVFDDFAMNYGKVYFFVFFYIHVFDSLAQGAAHEQQVGARGTDLCDDRIHPRGLEALHETSTRGDSSPMSSSGVQMMGGRKHLCLGRYVE